MAKGQCTADQIQSGKGILYETVCLVVGLIKSLARAAPKRSDFGDLIAHFIAHLIEKWPISTKCAIKCAIKSPWEHSFSDGL